MSVDKSLPVLHNAHVWAYFRHHPLDPDASLFVAFDEGSVRAYRELLALLIDNIQHRRRMPVGVREYGLRIVTALIEGARKQHARWLERKSKRKGAVGRPQAPSRGEIKRQVLAALYADLAAQNRPDPAQHGVALRVLQDELEQLKNTPAKRRRRSQPPTHSHHADLALSETTLISWRSLGRGPRFVRVGRAVRYRQADLDAFMVIMPCEESQP